jgi:hypothetical protein
LVRRVFCTVLLALAMGAGSARAATFTPGSSGLGDPMFPNAGNGGYDVKNYDLALDYAPTANQLAAPRRSRRPRRRTCRASTSTCATAAE